jgi:N-carbamoyl-L-amino-acid hydrolase
VSDDAAPLPDTALAGRLFAELRDRTGSRAGITRPSYGLGEQIAHDMVRREAMRLGLAVTTDAACNLYMTLRGERRGPALVVGSHLDSVPFGGNYDGAAGVLAGLAVAAGYVRAGRLPPQDLTVVAIRAEESTWFGASYVGSRAAFGRLSAQELDGVLRAGDLVRLGAAIDAAGGDSAALRRGEAHLAPAAVAAFLEVHIEQGPVLVAADKPAGIVTGIRGSFRHRKAACFGTYAHSGATPRASRADAVLAAARLLVALDDAALRLEAEGHDLTVTAGQFFTDSAEAAFSKVAGRVDFSLDVRSQSRETLDHMRHDLAAAVARTQAAHGVRIELGGETGSEPALMDGEIIATLAETAAAEGVEAPLMACGAGHDAAVFAAEGVPTGMIFIRNRNGSHNPHEAMDMADFAAACRILSSFGLRRLGPTR